MPKITTKRETAPVGSQKDNVHLEICAHSSMIRTRKETERDDIGHHLRLVHRTEIRKVTEEVLMTEVQQAHQNLLVKVRQEKVTDDLV